VMGVPEYLTIMDDSCLYLLSCIESKFPLIFHMVKFLSHTWAGSIPVTTIAVRNLMGLKNL
jgi:hypothetical protein